MNPNSASYDPQNIFAKILRKEIPARIVYENDFVLAFHDIAPKAPVHILVIPKKPYVSYVDFSQHATSEEMVALTKATAHIAKMQGLEEKGYRIVSNIGHDGGQEVLHFHIHILGGKPLPFT